MLQIYSTRYFLSATGKKAFTNIRSLVVEAANRLAIHRKICEKLRTKYCLIIKTFQKRFESETVLGEVWYQYFEKQPKMDVKIVIYKTQREKTKTMWKTSSSRNLLVLRLSMYLLLFIKQHHWSSLHEIQYMYK